MHVTTMNVRNDTELGNSEHDINNNDSIYKWKLTGLRGLEELKQSGAHKSAASLK